MTKRIKIHSVDSLISSICKTLPPSSKEDLKAINKLKIFVEKFTVPEKDNRITEYTDILFNKTLEVSYMRKDYCKEICEKYKKWASNVRAFLNQSLHDESLQIPEVKINIEDLLEIKKLNEDCDRLLERMNKILIENKSVKNTDRGIIKYFRAL